MPYKVREIRDIKELAQFQERMVDIYAEDQEPFEIMRLWWQNYPQGFLVLMDGQEILGSFCILPVTEDFFENICLGKVRERDLKTIRLPLNNSHKYWHISNIEISKKIQNTKIIKQYMFEVSNYLRFTGNFTNTVKVSAFVFSKDGEKYFNRLGFKLVKSRSNSIEKMPVYMGELLTSSLFVK